MSKQITRIPKTSITLEERETTIDIDPITKLAYVCSTIPATINKLYQMAEECDEVEIDLDNAFALGVTMPMKWIKIQRPRQMTEEQRAASAERLRAMRAAK